LNLWENKVKKNCASHQKNLRERPGEGHGGVSGSRAARRLTKLTWVKAIPPRAAYC